MNNLVLPPALQDGAIGAFKARQYCLLYNGHYLFWTQYFGSRGNAPRDAQSCNRRKLGEFTKGRRADYVLSSANARGKLGHRNNCTKEAVEGARFQVFRHDKNVVEVLMEAGPAFTMNEEEKLLSGLRIRFGSSMQKDLRRVDKIPTEKSGKFRNVRNLLAA